MEIDIFGGAGSGRSKLQNSAMAENLYLETDKEGNRAYIGTPGLKNWVDLEHDREIRGFIQFYGVLYIVCGEKFFSVSASGVKTLISGLLDSSYGLVTMAKNTGQIGIVDGEEYYLWKSDTNTLVKQNIATLPTPQSISDQDGYFQFNIKDSDLFYISGINDGETVDALEFSAADASPDYTEIIVPDHRELWFFGDESTEIFYNSGNADFPFERVPGAYITRGIGAAMSAVAIDNSLMWLDNFNQVVRAKGYSPQVISTPAIANQIAKIATKTDAFAYAYSQENHFFYILTFPTEGKTFCYDASTDHWTTRASGTSGGRHRGNRCIMFADKWIVGDFSNGKLYEYDLDTYTDDGNTVVSKVRFGVKSRGKKRMKHSNLELEIEAGVGISSGQGSDPKAILRFSDDFANTWSNERWRSIGKIGKRNTRVKWNKLGSSRNRDYEILISDPVAKHITGVLLNE